jgi:putative ABC transport system permease protein
MFKSYLKIAIRNLQKNKTFSFVNISGLAIGVACFILIGLFVADELTYDSYNVNADRIFRVNAHYKIGDNRFNLANSPVPLANVLATEYPEIQKSVRILQNQNTYVKKDDEFIKEEKFFYADSSMSDIFTINFVQGNPKTALTHPNCVVITTKTAEKYFDTKNPIGERITLSNKQDYLVTGVVKPVPQNSHFEFDFIASYNSLPESKQTNWFGNFVHTYVLTNQRVAAKELNSKIYSVTEKHIGPIIEAAFGLSYKEFLSKGNDFSFVFVPLKSIHLYSKVFNEFKESGDVNTIYLFSAIALFILIIACINFINLSTAKSTKRANEIGVRKALGSNKIQLIKQFLTESVLLCFIAVLLAIVLIEFALPSFNQLTGKQLSLNLIDNAYAVPSLLIFIILLGIVAGLYPALLLASFKPVSVLKSKASVNNNNGLLRKGLVVFQFSTSIILFIGTFVIYNQMQYIKNKNLGFNKDQVLIIKNIDDLGKQQFAFKDAVIVNSNVLNASLSQGLPEHSLSANIFRKAGSTDGNETLITIPVDYNFLNTYRIKMKEGRFFNKEITTDSSGIILNEAAVKKLNFADPLNSKLLYNLGEGKDLSLSVIGVVEDFHLQPLKDEIRPAAFVLLNEPEANFLSVKVSAHNISETIKYLSDKWKEFGQLKPMEYSFFDEYFADVYKSDIKAEKVFTIFALLAIVIACLGLFGLATFTAEQRTKEIGVRKVLGATITNIISMLSKEFLILVLLANLIAWPVAYFIMNNWLSDFAYKTDIGLNVFLFAGLVVLLIALLTVSYQAIKAARANPVKSLKYE